MSDSLMKRGTFRPPTHHLVDGSRSIQSGLPRHTQNLNGSPLGVKLLRNGRPLLLTILIVAEYLVPRIPAGGDVIDGSGVFDS